jgi:2-deoxy-D-gluconate 3-dehydrogenase
MLSDQFNLSGKIAIVTGARAGLGQGMACGLAEAGADVVGVDLGSMEGTKKTIESLGRKFLPIEENLSNVRVIEEVMKKTLSAFGTVNILINNAGIIRRADAIDFSEQDWDDVININLKAVFFFSQAAARQYIKQGTSGKIINIASMLSLDRKSVV